MSTTEDLPRPGPEVRTLAEYEAWYAKNLEPIWRAACEAAVEESRRLRKAEEAFRRVHGRLDAYHRAFFEIRQAWQDSRAFVGMRQAWQDSLVGAPLVGASLGTSRYVQVWNRGLKVITFDDKPIYPGGLRVFDCAAPGFEEKWREFSDQMEASKHHYEYEYAESEDGPWSVEVE